MRQVRAAIILLMLCASPGGPGAACAQATGRPPSSCDCDPARPETMESRRCSLCREAEKQPPKVPFFFLKDNNPRKPNRWLILPRSHAAGMQDIADLTPAQQAAFWKGAIERAREMWGDQWGLAVNGDQVRTQCHAHAHIGKLLESVQQNDLLLTAEGRPIPGPPPLVVKRPSQITAPRNGEAFWIHAAGKKLHVHIESPGLATEFVLVR